MNDTNIDENLYEIENDTFVKINKKNKHFTLTIPKNITSISPFACSCSNITSVNFNDVKTIMQGAFFNCYLLSQINIPEGVEEIQDEAFRNCPQLELVTLPSTIKKIGSNVFEGCKNLIIVYNGFKEDFQNIDIDKNNEFLFSSVNFARKNEIYEGVKEFLTSPKPKDYDNFNYTKVRLRLVNMPDYLYDELSSGDYLEPTSLLKVASLSNTTHGSLIPSLKGKPFFNGNPFSYHDFIKAVCSIKVIGKRCLKDCKPFVFVEVTAKLPKTFEKEPKINNLPLLKLSYTDKNQQMFNLEDFTFFNLLAEKYMPVPFGKFTFDCIIKLDEKLTSLYKNSHISKILTESLTFFDQCDFNDSCQNDIYFENINAIEIARKLTETALTIKCRISCNIKMLLSYACLVSIPTTCSMLPEY